MLDREHHDRNAELLESGQELIEELVDEEVLPEGEKRRHHDDGNESPGNPVSPLEQSDQR